MKECKECNIDISSIRSHSGVCHTCYRRRQRQITLLRKDRTCIVCNSCSSVKWYSGPKCRSCYRNSAYAKNRVEKSDKYKIERIKNNLRSRVSKIVSGSVKKCSAVSDLGCSIEELKQHLESQFQEGMSWDNYGHSGWHIDHIRPLVAFDLTNEEELKVACHYTNLQPLWATDNLSKGSKYE